MKVFSKIKSFFQRIVPTKRRIVQLYAALLYNAHIRGFISGDIFKGMSKSVCVPGLNCYSCPGAIGACPLGSLQNALYQSKTKLPTYVFGIILLYMIIFGRTICGFLCPVGLFQELLYKVKTPKLKKSKFTRILSYFKYVLLIVLVIMVPLIYVFFDDTAFPAFCKYICPAGIFEGSIFLLARPKNSGLFSLLRVIFTWKFMLLIIFIVASVFIYRFFCRFFCPLGAIYGIFNKLSILGVKVDKSKCTNCNACVSKCKMDVLEVGDHECIQCGECMNVCHVNAISWKTIHKQVKLELEKEKEQNSEETNNIQQIDEISKKENKKNIVKVIVSAIAIVLLVVVLIFSNFNIFNKKDSVEIYDINDVYSDLVVNLNDKTTFNASNNNISTLLYFYETMSVEEINQIKDYADDRFNIILIAKDETKITDEFKNEFKDLNVAFANVNSNNELLSKFTKDISYPYSVFLNKDELVLINKKGLINNNEYDSIISVTIDGTIIIGNKVGNKCFNKVINLTHNAGTFSVTDNLGKIVVMNFWFTSCTPCVKELPHFNKIYNEYSEYMTMIAIHSGSMYVDDPEEVHSYIDKKFGDYNILFGYDDENNSYYNMLGGIDTWPMTIIVDQEGFIKHVIYDALSEESLRTMIEEMLNE